MQPLAERGLRRALVLGAYYAGLGIGALLGAAATLALVQDQPRYVVVTLALTGALVVAPFLFDLPRLNRLYREAEMRSTIATDL